MASLFLKTFRLSSKRLLQFCLLVENRDISTPAGAHLNEGLWLRGVDVLQESLSSAIVSVM